MWSFKTDAAALRKALRPHQFIHPNQSPVEWHTVLTESESGVSITTTNHTLIFYSKLEVKVESDLDDYLTVAFPLLRVMAYLKDMGSEVFTVFWSESRIEFRSIGGFIAFETGDPNDAMIDFAMDTQEGSFEVSPVKLQTAMRFVRPAISTDLMRPTLITVLLERSSLDKDKVCAVATDGHLLGWTQFPMKNPSGDFRFITDGLAAKFITDYFPVQDDKLAGVVTFMNTVTEVEPMKVSWGENRSWFEHNGCILMVVNPDGEYPKYRNVIPETGDNVIFIKRDKWVPLLKQMLATMGDSIDFGVTFDLGVIDPGRITMTRSSVDAKGKGRITMPGTYQGVAFVINFNIKYLLAVIEAMPGQGIRIYLTGRETAAVVIPETAPDDYLYLVMPMRD